MFSTNCTVQAIARVELWMTGATDPMILAEPGDELVVQDYDSGADTYTVVKVGERTPFSVTSGQIR